MQLNLTNMLHASEEVSYFITNETEQFNIFPQSLQKELHYFSLFCKKYKNELLWAGALEIVISVMLYILKKITGWEDAFNRFKVDFPHRPRQERGVPNEVFKKMMEERDRKLEEHSRKFDAATLNASNKYGAASFLQLASLFLGSGITGDLLGKYIKFRFRTEKDYSSDLALVGFIACGLTIKFLDI